jgi:hypothetical protein
MRYMALIKMEPNGTPQGRSDELDARLGKLLEEMTKAGALLDSARLTPLDQATRIRLSGGKFTVLDGPFTEAKEVIGGYALVQSKSQDEVIEWGKRFAAAHGDDWDSYMEIRAIEELA